MRKKIKNEFTDSFSLMGLRELGIDLVVVEYSGGGDSGAIDEKNCYINPKIVYDEEGEIEYVDDSGINVEGLSEEDFGVDKQGRMSELLDNIENSIIMNLLNGIEDWWNNEGGRGTFYLDLKTSRYRIENTCFGEADYDEETDEYDYENQEEWNYTHQGKV
jgi:hypothetical protein